MIHTYNDSHIQKDQKDTSELQNVNKKELNIAQRQDEFTVHLMEFRS